MKKYPQPIDPFKSQTEFIAWLFGIAHNAYSMLAQYEAEQDEAEKAQLRDILSGSKEAAK